MTRPGAKPTASWSGRRRSGAAGLLGRPRRIATSAAIALLLAGCIGQPLTSPGSPSPSPVPSPERADPSPGTSQPPTTKPSASAGQLPTPNAPVDLGCADIRRRTGSSGQPLTPEPVPEQSIPGADPATVAAITESLAALGRLGSYRFTTELSGRDPLQLQGTTTDWGLRGTLVRASGPRVDAEVGIRMREPDGSASVSYGFRMFMGDGYIWAVDPRTGVAQPSPSGQADTLYFQALLPEGLAARLVGPFAGAFEPVGGEDHGGIHTTHFRATTAGAAAYATVLRFDGTLTADLWIADDGYLAAATIAGTTVQPSPSPGAVAADAFGVALEVSDVDNPSNTVTLPVEPSPEPSRPGGPPVGVRLTYRVEPAHGSIATPREVGDLAVMIRSRLNIGTRPVGVDVVGTDRLVVTICSTTNPDWDRTTIEATRALTIVPLPAGHDGSATAAGSKALPVVGGPIDPALQPVAPASRVGLTGPYVDPVTGRRGVAFQPSNETLWAFQAYAKAHAGEYVAVVLDGVVMSVLRIEGKVAEGQFTFTGDYTETEAHDLSWSLYEAPLPYPLVLVDEVIAPAQ